MLLIPHVLLATGELSHLSRCLDIHAPSASSSDVSISSSWSLQHGMYIGKHCPLLQSSRAQAHCPPSKQRACCLAEAAPGSIAGQAAQHGGKKSTATGASSAASPRHAGTPADSSTQGGHSPADCNSTVNATYCACKQLGYAAGSTPGLTRSVMSIQHAHCLCFLHQLLPLM